MPQTAALPILSGETGLTRYLEEIRRFPILEPQEEFMLAKRWREHRDDGSAHKLSIAPAKIVTTVDRHGNTSAASIPLALADAVADRRIKRGDLLLLEAMGGGFTWGAALVRW